MKELVIVRTIGIRNSMAKKAAITVAMLMRIFSNIFFLFLNRIALLSSGGTGFFIFCSISLPHPFRNDFPLRTEVR